MIRFGPAGSSYSGSEWSEKGRSKISHIVVSCDEWGVSSLQFGFVEDGVIVLSKQYGHPCPRHHQVVKLKHPSEFITGLSGELFDNESIASLTFHTNERTHGPFNALYDEVKRHARRRAFALKMGDGDDFGGFFGYSDSRLYSIGFYFTPKLTTT